MPRKPYPTDVSDEEWSFAGPYLTLMEEAALQRCHDLREVFNALRWLIRAGAPWRLLPHDFHRGRRSISLRWVEAGCFEAIVSDLRSIIRVAQGRQGQPSAIVLDSRTLQSSCESGPRAGYDGYKHKRGRGSKVHMAVDTLGHLPVVHVTPADEQERARVKHLCAAVQQATGHTVELAWADQGYTGDKAREAAQEHGIALQIVKLLEAKKGFVLLPKRWVVERGFGWLARFRRLSRDYERLPEVLSGLHFLVFAVLMLPNAAKLFGSAGSS